MSINHKWCTVFYYNKRKHCQTPSTSYCHFNSSVSKVTHECTMGRSHEQLWTSFFSLLNTLQVKQPLSTRLASHSVLLHYYLTLLGSHMPLMWRDSSTLQKSQLRGARSPDFHLQLLSALQPHLALKRPGYIKLLKVLQLLTTNKKAD